MGKVAISVTLDWEGDETDSQFKRGIQEVEGFHNRHPLVPITHFVCPVTFVADKKETAERNVKLVNDLLGKKLSDSKADKAAKDEVALHIHCWGALMAACGVDKSEILTAPTYHKVNDPTMERRDGVTDKGHGVYFGSYSKENIAKTLKASKNILFDVLSKDLFEGENIGFRCGGWVASDPVLEVLAEQKFLYDASALDAGYVPKGFQNDSTSLGDDLQKLWGKSSQTAGQLKNNTIINAAFPNGIYIYDSKNSLFTLDGLLNAQPKALLKNFIEVPDTALLADYISDKDMLSHIQVAVDASSKTDKDLYVSIGAHFSSGDNFAKLTSVVDEVQRKNSKDVRFVRVAQVASEVSRM